MITPEEIEKLQNIIKELEQWVTNNNPSLTYLQKSAFGKIWRALMGMIRNFKKENAQS